jgi:aryl-alcohol dehydrogenase-like predicted oxidoreductase
VPFSPLGRAFLTGRITSPDDIGEHDLRRNMPRFTEEHFGSNLKRVELLGQIAQEKGCTAGQLALAWVMAQRDDYVPIPGTKHVDFLEENTAAAELVLSEDELQRVGETIGPDNVCGDRYGRSQMISLDPEE